MQASEIEQQLAKAFWDVAVDPDELYKLLTGELEKVGHISRERLYRRLMETFSWYQVLEIVPGDQIENMLHENTISKLRNKSLQKRYETLAEILRRNTVSAAE